MNNLLLTPQETAEILHINVNTLAVWRCTNRYKLSYVKIGRKVFYKPDDIENFIKSRTINP